MLIDNIQKALFAARKEKNSVVVTILTTLFGEAQMIGKNNGNRLTTDDEVIKVCKKFSENIDSTIALISDEKKKQDLLFEKQIISQFIPQQLSFEELSEKINEILSSIEVKDKKAIGLVNKSLKEKYSGLYDGKMVQEILSKLIT